MKDIIEKAWKNKDLLKNNDVKKSILNVIESCVENNIKELFHFTILIKKIYLL